MQFGQYVAEAAAAAIVSGIIGLVKLVVHACGAVGARKRTATLGGDVADAPTLVQHVTRQEWYGIERLDRVAQPWPRLVLSPDVWDIGGWAAGLQCVDEVEQSSFAFAET